MKTVKELKKQLEILIELGYGEAEVWYRDEDSIDHGMESGVWDTWEDKDGKGVALA